MSDNDRTRTEQLKSLCNEHCPEVLDFLRRLYNAGLIPGARALRSVTVNGIRHDAYERPCTVPRRMENK